MGAFTTYDHVGNRYKNKSEMAAYYGIGHERLHGRLHTGWPLMDALLLKPAGRDGIKFAYKSFAIISDGITFPDGTRRYACTCRACGKHFAMSVPEMESHATHCTGRNAKARVMQGGGGDDRKRA